MTWLDIKLRQYIDIDAVVKDSELSDEERLVALCQAVYGVNILQQPFTEYTRYTQGLAFLNEKMPDMTLSDTYVINGTRYVFNKSVKNFTVGQFMDYQSYAKGEKSLDTYASILTIFLIPEGCKYNDGYDIAKARKDMLDLSAPVALSMAAFFLTCWKNFVRVFLLFSMWKVLTTRKIPKAQKKEILTQMREMIKKPPMVGDFSL